MNKIEYLERALRVARAERDEAKASIKALEKEQSAWRKFTDEANRTLEAADKKIATLQARIQAALEVYAGMEGFIPETAAEGYCLRIIEQMNEALQESDDERV